ncbi:MAG: hypothetical protein ACR5LG_10380 [Sodalis sp. (in: enterobacteria)]
MLALLIPAWGLMGCSATAPPSATPPMIMPPCSRPPANLLVLPPMPPVKGLGPEVLLHHASDYGAWCLTLRAQLQAINAFYSAQERPRDEP